MKKVSLQDMANQLGVSKTLVSLVLNGKGNEKGISKETQKRVLSLSKKLNYNPNQMARSLRLGSSNTIGLIVADISNVFFSHIARSIEDEAAKHGYNVMFMSSEENAEKERKMIQILKDRRVDGLILATSFSDRTEIQKLRDERIPFVLIDRYLPGVKTNYVIVDNHKGAYDLTSHLIGLKYNRIALLKITPTHLIPIKQRTEGYKEALRDHGIPVRNNLIRNISFENIREEIESNLKDLILDHGVQALFFLNNNLAVAGLEVLNNLNLRIPQDIALAAFDDIDLFKFAYPPVTAISQPLEDIGRNAIKILLKEMKSPSIHSKKQMVLPVNLIVRRSCGAFLKQADSITINDVQAG